MELNDNKLKWFFDKELLQKTVDACVQKGINLAEVCWFTKPENRVELAKQMAAGQYHIAPPHIIQIPKPHPVGRASMKAGNIVNPCSHVRSGDGCPKGRAQAGSS